MKRIPQNLLILCLLLFSLTISIPAQTSAEEFAHKIAAAEIVAKLEAQKLIPRDDSEVLIVGEVRMPGIINYSRIRTSRKISLLEAITLAGGLSENGDKRIRVIRKDVKFGYPIDIFIDLAEIRQGKQNVYLESGDIIIAPKSTESEKPKTIRPNPILPKDTPLPVRIPLNIV